MRDLLQGFFFACTIDPIFTELNRNMGPTFKEGRVLYSKVSLLVYGIPFWVQKL